MGAGLANAERLTERGSAEMVCGERVEPLAPELCGGVNFGGCPLGDESHNVERRTLNVERGVGRTAAK